MDQKLELIIFVLNEIYKFYLKYKPEVMIEIDQNTKFLFGKCVGIAGPVELYQAKNGMMALIGSYKGITRAVMLTHEDIARLGNFVED